MTFARPSRTASFRLTLAASVAVAALGAGQALGQEAEPGDPILVEADELTRPSDDVITARGDVEAWYLGRTLTADQLSLDSLNGVITAQGDIQVFNPDGTAEFADSLVLDDQLRAGVITGFSARLANNVKFAAARAIRYNENLTELDMAIFTPCDICTAEGQPKEPTWSVAAEQVIQDKDRKVVHYRNAVIRVKGVPVLWTPVFWHADPEAESATGLLPPRFIQNDRLGLSYEQPFLWVISPSQDLIVSPQLNTEVNPFLNFAWRKRFYTGLVEARVGYTRERDFNTEGDEYGESRDKAYILAAGVFEPTPNWTWGFAAERVRDKLVFDQYSIGDIYQVRGPFLSDDRRLLSQLYTIRQTDQSYFSVAALSFQSLRPILDPITGQPAPNPDPLEAAFGIRPLEDDDILPTVAPLIEARYEPRSAILGGRLRLRGSAVALDRQESPLVPAAPGIDSRRITAEFDWRRFVTLANGMRLEPFLQARGDAYSVADLPTGTETTSRGLSVVGVDFSWPFIKHMGGAAVIVEPIAQLALSPDAKTYPFIPNEDSIAFDFDYTNLFEANKPPGFDLYESGQRLNVGVRTSVDWGDGRNAHLVVGRSYRADVDPVFAARTGLRTRQSDWVLAAEATPINGLWFYGKARFETDTLDIRRAELGANVQFDRGAGYLRYLREDEDFSGVAREDVEAAGEVFLTQNWGVTFDAVLDIEQSRWRRQSAGIAYRDECTRFDIIWQREEDPVLGGRSSDTVGLRLTLATLGDAGYRDYRNR